MSDSNQSLIFSKVKKKVVIGFLFAALALMLAWGVSKFVFGEILGNLQEISAPNHKLRLVNQLSHQIAGLDYLQRNQNENKNYIAATAQLGKSLDTLSTLFAADTAQFSRIETLKKLLVDRNKQYHLYLKVRESLVSTQSYSEELEKLTILIAQRTRNADSAVFTTQTSTSTKTLATDEEQRSKGFFSRLFGKKKAEVFKIIDEEYKIKRDTINPQTQDSLINNVTATLKSLADEQREKSNRFLRREAELANSGAALTKEMLSVLKEVENDALTQLDRNELEAKSTVDEGVFQIKVIIVVFFVITLILCILILVDISKNNKYRLALEIAKEEAEYHGKAKQRFLSNMSHEIRTPLQSILGYAELVAGQNHPDKNHLQAIHQSSTHLLQIVNEVLDYNRIISGEFSFEERPFHLTQLLTEVINAVKPMANQKGLALQTDYGFDQQLWLQGDAFRLKQILFNLLGNAIKFTNQGYVKLAVDCREVAGQMNCYFTISDSGIGFTEDESGKIFNEFEQATTTPHQAINQNGTGLGLTIVKTLVDAQGGRIGVKTKLGEGSAFEVYLKFLRVEAPLEMIPQKTISSKPANKMVWIIDDDRLITNLCEIILKNHDIPHQIFNSAAAILAEPMPENLAFVFVDMRLEDTTGMELMKLLKQKLPDKVKYYAMTAQVLPDEQEAVLSAGFEGILMKPFRAEDLLHLFQIDEEGATEPAFDTSALLKMTMGDEELVGKLLASFVDDCATDEAVLKHAISQGNLSEIHLVVHRLAGRLAQIGAKDLGATFRLLEQEVAASTQLSKAISSKINEALVSLDELVHQIKKRVLLAR